jgi:electron transfer flavoprotein alpha subunit
MLAIVPVRNGTLPAGGAEAVAEAGGRALIVGSKALLAAEELAGVATEVRIVETPTFAPAAWATALADVLADEPALVLPASADGRDLAPRLAYVLSRPLLAGATAVGERQVMLSRRSSQVIEETPVSGPFVATLIPGVRGVSLGTNAPAVTRLDLTFQSDSVDAVVIEELPPDVTTMDLAEAPRIVGGGAGLDTAERFGELGDVAARLGASLGATRVITDRGWLGHDRQIGTTGVVVNPQLYLAFGISGAVQHTTGLGNPAHIISVNTDPHCPMMQLADVAIVSDANAVVDELHARLCRG